MDQSESGCVTGNQSSVYTSTQWTVTTLLLHLEMGEHVCPLSPFFPYPLLFSPPATLFSSSTLSSSSPPFLSLFSLPLLFFLFISTYLVNKLFLTVAYDINLVSTLIHVHVAQLLYGIAEMSKGTTPVSSVLPPVAPSRLPTSHP